jgi:hypothetical protein
MKNQYVGDIGDFAKYYLLRKLAERKLKNGKNVVIGVNWYLTDDDDSSEGGQVGYLFNRNSDEYKADDHMLYDMLRCILDIILI